mmetsp:Transcript_127895/g.225361  ORF Transcript_127895/g.225361 Transcript_127895/m.225361 type:complete len:90 (-) Transcript_127895:9-278(-)
MHPRQGVTLWMWTKSGTRTFSRCESVKAWEGYHNFNLSASAKMWLSDSSMPASFVACMKPLNSSIVSVFFFRESHQDALMHTCNNEEMA